MGFSTLGVQIYSLNLVQSLEKINWIKFKVNINWTRFGSMLLKVNELNSWFILIKEIGLLKSYKKNPDFRPSFSTKKSQVRTFVSMLLRFAWDFCTSIFSNIIVLKTRL